MKPTTDALTQPSTPNRAVRRRRGLRAAAIATGLSALAASGCSSGVPLTDRPRLNKEDHVNVHAPGLVPTEICHQSRNIMVPADTTGKPIEQRTHGAMLIIREFVLHPDGNTDPIVITYANGETNDAQTSYSIIHEDRLTMTDADAAGNMLERMIVVAQPVPYCTALGRLTASGAIEILNTTVDPGDIIDFPEEVAW